MFDFSEKLITFSKKMLKSCENEFEKIDKIVSFNQQKVLKAFIETKVSESHFNSTTGYGYSDLGRETLDKLFSKTFDAEDSLVRHNFVSGTHAITTALYGILRPKDAFLSIIGLPYESLYGVIGINGNEEGSLKEFNIDFKHINFDKNGEINYKKIEETLKKAQKRPFKMVYIQRSRGYSFRNSLTTIKLKKAIDLIKKYSPYSIIVVDNCYGEFVQEEEPLECGADLIIGSLIKNPGGGIARSGGYISGKKNLIKLCTSRLTNPGVGKNVGATFGLNRELFMGFFNAPQAVGEALKTAVFTSLIFEESGYEVFPKYDESRADIVQTIKLNSKEKLLAFCKGLQKASPIDSFVVPEAWEMPNYDEKIIMAAGTFTAGATSELSADAPFREPYAVWVQGGLNFHSAKIGILSAFMEVLKV